MKKTKIEWCDATWNPVTGCRHRCEYCYARRIAFRFGGASYTTHNENGYECQWLTQDDGIIHDLSEPVFDVDRNRKAPYPFDFAPTFHRYKLDEPARWQKPRTIFVCSMADLFGKWVPDEWIAAVFAACKRAPQHRYLFLTKNPARYLELAASETGLPQAKNMWYGSTATNQDALTFYSDWHQTFVSIEPILGPFDYPGGGLPKAKWIIMGAMTGSGSNDHKPKAEWISNICKTADRNGSAVFMKDSLIPIIGEENMRREFPWNKEGTQ